MWKTIPSFPKYEASSKGQIRNKKNGKIRKLQQNGSYYEVVVRSNSGKRFTCRVHRLIAETFIPNPEKLPEVNHKNGLANNIENLEWCTRSENNKHAIRTGLRKTTTRSVYQVSKTGKLMRTFPSSKKASELLGISASGITSVCKGRGLTLKGWYWCYEEDFSEFQIEKRGHKNQKKIEQIDKTTGEIIKIWDSVKQASQELGLHHPNICVACKKPESSSGGYKWRYVQEISIILEDPYKDWISLPDFPKYKISRDGRVYSLSQKKLLRPASNKSYLMVNLRTKCGGRQTISVHQLVARAYIREIEGKSSVRHKNGIKDDNRVENLEWALQKEIVSKSQNKRKKGVIQMNLGGEEIDRFSSIKEASDLTGTSYSGISKVCRGVAKVAGESKWKFD